MSSVLLPAPLRPMMPSTSPCLTSRSTSLSAQRSSRRVRGRARVADALDRSLGRLHQRVAQRAVRLALAADAVHLAETDGAQGDITHGLHHIGEHPLHALEVEEAADEQHHDHADRDPHVAAGELLPEERPAKAADDAGHGVEGEGDAQRTRGDAARSGR